MKHDIHIPKYLINKIMEKEMKTQPVKEYVRRMEREIKIKQKEQNTRI